MDNKKNKNKSPVWAIIVIVYVALKIIADGDQMNIPALIIGMTAAVVIVGVLAYIRKKNLTAKQNGEREQTTVKVQARPATEARSADRNAITMNLTHEKKIVEPDNGDKYIAQLNGFLKNGLIDGKEYRLMLERYKKNGNIQ